MINPIQNIKLFEDAQATTQASTSLFGSNIWSTVLTFGLLIAVVVVFYFVVLRPNKKQQQKEEQMKNSLKVGDFVTTIGGIVGVVVAIKGDTFTIITSKEKTRLVFQRSALKSIDNFEPVQKPAENTKEEPEKTTNETSENK